MDHVFNTRHGNFLIAARLASGGMGEVFLAMNPEREGFDRFVALKCLHPHFNGDVRVTEMFYREARIGALFRHKNLVRVSDVRWMGDRHTMVMEFAAGVTLRQILDRAEERQERISTIHALEILEQACRGLHHAHTLRRSDGQHLDIVHRDLSPDNILVGFDGLVRVIDFGVAAAAGKQAESGLAGKIAYMSPEQCRGAALDARSDLYSVGTVLWEALVGHAPYPRTDRISALRMITEEQLTRPALLSERSDADDIDGVWERLHAKDVNARYRDAREVADALEALARTVHDDCGETLGAWVQRLFPHEAAEIRTTCEKIVRAPSPSDHTVNMDDFAGSVTPNRRPPTPPARPKAPRSTDDSEEMVHSFAQEDTQYLAAAGDPEAMRRWRRQRAILLGTIAFLVLAMGGLIIAYMRSQAAQPTGPVAFMVTTEPEGAVVQIDGVEVDTPTPTTVRAADGHTMDLLVRAPGYLAHTEQLRVQQKLASEGHHITLQVDRNSPIAPIGSVHVAYEPADATFLINGVVRATASPAVVSGIALNTLHTLRLERDGYQTLFLDLRLYNEQTLEFDLQMSEGVALARLSVEAEPGGEVYIDGQLVGATPIEKLGLPAQTTYEVSVRAPGYREWRRGVALQNDDVAIVARLERVGATQGNLAAEETSSVPSTTPTGSSPRVRAPDDLPYRMIE